MNLSQTSYLSVISDELIQKWMEKVDALEVQIEGKEVSVLMHKNWLDYKIFMEGWLNGEITTEHFKEFLENRYWWVQYPLRVFESVVYNA
jgi:hypothetical protein